MKKIALLASLALVAQFASAADITGTVKLSGTPPKESPNEGLKAHAVCGKAYTEMPTTHHFVVSADGGLANVVVMLKGVTAKSTGAAAPAVVVDQKGCLYTPQIFAVQTGQTISVKNSDSELHNVHTKPTVAGNEEANKAQMAGSPDLSFSFAKPENFIKFQCDVHPWMFAWVTVVDHPYFAVTDKDGKFTIKDAPAGKYKIVAMHRKAAKDGVEKDVDVSAGNATVDFTLEAPAAK